MNRTVLFLTFTVASALSIRSAQWPQWRGPTGQGIADATDLPTHWSETSNVVWKTVLPGGGWSSPVIESNHIWLTTAIETAARPEDVERRLKANTGDQPLTLLEKVELRALCVDRDSGRLLHNILLLEVREPQWVHRLNSYASPTPVLDQGRLFAHFGALGTAALDTRTGKVLWTSTNLVVMHENGPGSSPVLWRDLLIFHMDGSDRQFIAALDARTGKLAWQTERSGEMNPRGQQRKSYGTPLLLEINGAPQIISPAADWVYGYEPSSGNEVWKIPYGQLGFSISPRPVAGHGMFFMSTGFGKKQMLAIRYEGVPAPTIVWRYSKGVPSMPSPLLAGNELIFVDDGGFVTCLEARTGAEHYRERLGGNYSSSPLLADGKIYIGSREGVMTVLRPGKTFEVLARNELSGAIMATPAALDGALFVRTEQALYRLGAAETSRTAIPPGKGRSTVRINGHDLDVFTYRPRAYAGGPLLVVLHGMNRNAEDYRDHAVPLADRANLLVVAPRFDSARFTTEAYQRGGVTLRGVVQPPKAWTFSYLPKLVAAVRAGEGRPDLPYDLIGHSAGGQFLTRLAAFQPGEATRIIAGNPGSHLFATRDLPFQYGFGGLPEELGGDEAIRRYLAAPLTLLLGTADTGEKNLDKSATAMRQGATRIERGRNAYHLAEQLARRRGWAFNWTLVEVPGVAHDSKALFAHPLTLGAVSDRHSR
jgi:outer membrane protein assembly factor BamB/poly(3-hydroxybutyrate) depolymerase